MQSKMDLGTIEIPITVMGEKFSMDEVKKPFTFGSTKFIDKETGNALNVCPENSDKINNADVDLRIKGSGSGSNDLYQKAHGDMEVVGLFPWARVNRCIVCGMSNNTRFIRNTNGRKGLECKCGYSIECDDSVSDNEMIDMWNGTDKERASFGIKI